MTYLPIILIAGGYCALVWQCGWWGVGLAAVHVGVMVLAGHISARQRGS